MLIEFRVKNFRSFKDEQVLSMVASSDTSLPENFSKVGKYNVLKAAAIYGPNASGKSNLLSAIQIMIRIIKESANYQKGQKIPLAPFLLSEKSKKEPVEFEITFLHKKIRYQYGFSATTDRIEEEWLYAYPKESPQAWFERPLKGNIKFSTLFKGEKKKIETLTGENSLFLSRGAQLNHEQLGDIFDWFEQHFIIKNRHTILMPITEQFLYGNDKEAADFIINLIRTADFGVSGLDVKYEPISDDKFVLPDDMPPSVKDKLMEKVRAKNEYKVFLKHKAESSQVLFPLHEESEGTEKFFHLIGPWIHALVNGQTVIIDELESSLHPLLSRQLIQGILNEDNKTGAQLIFATHDTTLMDPDLFRRDQIWFAEKNNQGATELYSLAEYKDKPRKNEPMQKKYLSGRYGAIPILEAFSIHE